MAENVKKWVQRTNGWYSPNGDRPNKPCVNPIHQSLPKMLPISGTDVEINTEFWETTDNASGNNTIVAGLKSGECIVIRVSSGVYTTVSSKSASRELTYTSDEPIEHSTELYRQLIKILN